MRTQRTIAAGLVAGFAALAGCLYTDGINERPVARITVQDDPPFYKGAEVRFDAQKSTDDHRGGLVAHWLVIHCPPGAADTECSAVDPEVEMSLGDVFAATIPGKGEVKVQLTVEDGRGARSQDIEVLNVENKEPAVDLQAPEAWVVDTPYLLYAQVDDDDGDEVALEWEYFPPGASQPDQVTFEEVDATTRRLVPDVTGPWEVRVTASDPEGGEDQAEDTTVIDLDRPPCIGLTDPAAVKSQDAQAVADARFIVDRDGGPRRFAVLTVEDDLDPYPAEPDPAGVRGETSFAWAIATPETGGALVPLGGREAPDYVLEPSGFAPGDRVTLRVEAHDRESRALCPDDEPTCAANDEAPGCFQRLTWEVEIR